MIYLHIYLNMAVGFDDGFGFFDCVEMCLLGDEGIAFQFNSNEGDI